MQIKTDLLLLLLLLPSSCASLVVRTLSACPHFGQVRVMRSDACTGSQTETIIEPPPTIRTVSSEDSGQRDATSPPARAPLGAAAGGPVEVVRFAAAAPVPAPARPCPPPPPPCAEAGGVPPW